jgi:hypothetical protein
LISINDANVVAVSAHPWPGRVNVNDLFSESGIYTIELALAYASGPTIFRSVDFLWERDAKTAKVTPHAH